jgi:large subunit ribosomal protein L10
MRPEKESMYSEMKERVEGSVFLILTDYDGLNVSTGQALRSALREVDAEFHVLKNRVFKHVAKEVCVGDLDEGLKGPTAIVTGNGEVTAVAKVLQGFIKERKLPVIKMGAMQGVVLSAADIDELAKLPSREEMLAQVLSALSAPLTEYVNVMHGMIGGFVNVLQSLEDKKADQA